MKSIIEELFYGNIDPSRPSSYSEEYAKMSREFSGIRNRFQNTLPINYQDEFEYVINKSFDLSSYAEKALFSMGLCLGVRLMLEVLQYDN